MNLTEYSEAYRAIIEILEGAPKQLQQHSSRVHDLAVTTFPEDYSVRIVALSHDVIEDLDITYESLLHINKELADDVLSLTRLEHEFYDEYMNRILQSNKTVLKVKLLDVVDHLLQFETLKPSLKQRYLRYLPILLDSLQESNIQ